MSYLTECTDRILKLCKLTITDADGVPHFFYKGSGTPYFTMRLGQDDITTQSSDRGKRSYLIIVRYVIGHVTSKYEGKNESRLYVDIPAIENAFAMAGTRLTVPPDHPQPQNDLSEILLTPTRGLSVFPAVPGIEGQQVGTEFTLRATFNVNVPGHH
jgi:hypothetical protein